MKYVIWLLVLCLIIAHQDVWNWEDASLVFGFLPKGLAYHAGISIAAAVVWYLATLFAWPTAFSSLAPSAASDVAEREGSS